LILGIETSTAVCSVGFADENGLRAERSLVESHIHSEKLLTLIQELCDMEQVTLRQIDGVAFSIGPGSFTGLRIGLSTAKGLCYALDRPLLAVPTFLSMAKSVFREHPNYPKVGVCIDAKQREYYIGVYEKRDGMIREVLPVQIGTLPDLAAASASIIVTDRLDSVKTESRGSDLIMEVFPYCRGDMVAATALEQGIPGRRTGWEELEPMYLKDFVVRTRTKLEQ